MNIFVLEIWDDEGWACTFYTVRNDDTQISETDSFFVKYHAMPQYTDATRELLSFVLDAIGEEHGAVEELFNRNENEVIGLPVQGRVTVKQIMFHYPGFPLRLYALKITDGIVVLFNGGIKDGATNQKSSLHMHWRAACEYAKRIIDAINNGTVIVNVAERTLENYDGSEEIIL